jgi:hypothetical protein
MVLAPGSEYPHIGRYHKDVMVVETAYPSRDLHTSAAAAKT